MATTPTVHLVGRQAELERVAGSLDAARNGDAAFILVLGEAGIGKTSFLRAARWLAESRGFRTLAGTAIAAGASIPYLPIVAPLREATRSATGDDPAAAAVRAALEGEGTTDEGADAARAARLIESVHDVLVRAPTLLLVDDVHWADAATLAVLDYLAVRATDAPMAVIAAAGDDEPELLARLPIADGRRYLQLPLPRLSRDAVQQQVNGLVGSAVSGPMINDLHARSAGNPLHVEEQLAELPVMTGMAVRSSGSLRALVKRRVEGLAPDARRAAEALAVIGRAGRPEFIRVVAGLDATTTEAALADAERGGAVVRLADGHALRHPLFGEVLTEAMGGTTRCAEMHRRAAVALESAGAGAAELAEHWAAAGHSGRTWSASLEAADQAQLASAFAESLLHLERALDHWPPGTDGRAAARLRAARAAWMTGDPGRAVALARSALDEGADDIEAQVALAQYLWDAGERDVATAAFARAAGHLSGDSPARTRAIALWGLGRARIGQGNHADARRLAEASAAAAEEAADPAWVSQAWVLAGMSRAWISDIGGIEDLRRGLPPALESGDPEAIGHAYQFLVEQLWLGGELNEARRIGLEGIPACERYGLARSHGADVRGRTALVLLDLGGWAAAERVLEGAEPRAYSSIARALLALRRGEWAAAERELAASATGESIGGRGRLGGLTELARVELSWLRGDEPAAVAELDAIPDQPGVWGVDIEARRALWRARLRRDDATAAHHFDLPFLHALEAERRARRTGDDESWDAAITAWSAAERPYERAVALLGAAEAALAARDRAIAKARLRDLRDLATTLGALPLVEAADGLARRARVTIAPRARPSADPSRLTARELEVLGQMAEGRTNPQIAQELFLSPKTVGIHVSRVLEKLEAHTRGEAVATARRRGILP